MCLVVLSFSDWQTLQQCVGKHLKSTHTHTSKQTRSQIQDFPPTKSAKQVEGESSNQVLPQSHAGMWVSGPGQNTDREIPSSDRSSDCSRIRSCFLYSRPTVPAVGSSQQLAKMPLVIIKLFFTVLVLQLFLFWFFSFTLKANVLRNVNPSTDCTCVWHCKALTPH